MKLIQADYRALFLPHTHSNILLLILGLVMAYICISITSQLSTRMSRDEFVCKNHINVPVQHMQAI